MAERPSDSASRSIIQSPARLTARRRKIPAPGTLSPTLSSLSMPWKTVFQSGAGGASTGPERRGILEQLATPQAAGSATTGFLRPDDRQRDEDRARPGRQVVDGERRTAAGRRASRAGWPGRSPTTPARTSPGAGACRCWRARRRPAADDRARGAHVRRVGRLARHLEREVAEAGDRQLRRAAEVLAPAAAGQRLGANDARQIADFVALATIEERFNQDEVAFQRGVALQLPLPEPLRRLPRDQPVARGGDGGVEARARRRRHQQASVRRQGHVVMVRQSSVI